jgi:hypothetical protein
MTFPVVLGPRKRSAVGKVRTSRHAIHWLGAWRLPFTQTGRTCSVNGCEEGSYSLTAVLIDGELILVPLCSAHVEPVAIASGAAQ